MIRTFALPFPSVRTPGWNRERINRCAWPYLAITAIVLLAWLAYSWVFPIPVFPIDDAYIVFHNAQAVLVGRDPNYLGSSPLSGSTSPVHLALVTFLLGFLRPLAALSVAAWLSALLYALGLVRLGRVHGASPSHSLLLAAVGLIAGRTPYQLMNGLETGLMLAAVTWGLVLLSPKDSRPGRLVPALCGTLPFIRPDLLPLSVLFFGLHIRRHRQAGLSGKAVLPRLGWDFATALACAAPWMLWSYAENGSLMTSTMAAKCYFFAQAGWPAAVKIASVTHSLGVFGMELGLLTVFACFLGGTALGRAGIAFGIVLIAAYYVQFPGALGTYNGRYLCPLVPFFVLGAAQSLRYREKTVRLVAVWALAATLGLSLWTTPLRWRQHINNCRFTIAELDGVADWCNQHLPPNSTLLIHDAGYLSCKTRFPLIDLVGLKTPSSIAFHRRLTYPSDGRQRSEAIDQIALQSRPNYLLVLDSWEQVHQIAAGLQAEGWDVRLINHDFAYKVYSLKPPSR